MADDTRIQSGVKVYQDWLKDTAEGKAAKAKRDQNLSDTASAKYL